MRAVLFVGFWELVRRKYMGTKSTTNSRGTYALFESESYTASPYAFNVAGICCVSNDIPNIEEEN